MSKMTVHAVVGTGTAPEKVIIEGLNDVVSGNDCVGLIWAGKPNATTEVVYDYVLDNDLNFIMYYAEGVTPPRVFRESENGVVQKVRNPIKAAVQAVEGKGKILFLWDSDDEDQQVDPVFDFKNEGTLVLELTNGLAPIKKIDPSIPEPKELEVPKEEGDVDDDTRFTYDELVTMQAAAVKRYGARIGAKAATKAGIIAELFPDAGDGDDAQGVFSVPEETVEDTDPTDDTRDDVGKLASVVTSVIDISEEQYFRKDEVIASLVDIRDSIDRLVAAFQ